MSTSTELAKRGPRGVVARQSDFLAEEDVKLVRQLCGDLTEDEFRQFVYVCRARRLDPLLKQIYAVKRQGKVVHQTSIDGFRATAARTKIHAGTDEPTYEGAPAPGKPPQPGFVAHVTVWKLVGGVRCPFSAPASWEEYRPENPKDAWMWRKMPRNQLGKCAEALALRKAFPEDLGGLYTDDEMAQADVIDVRPTPPPVVKTEPTPLGVDSHGGALPISQPQRTARKRKAEPAVAPTPTGHEEGCGCDRCWPAEDVAKPAMQDTRSIDALGEKISRDQQKLLFAVAKEQGLAHDDLKRIVKKFIGLDSTSDIPKANFTALLAYVEGKPQPEVTA